VRCWLLVLLLIVGQAVAQEPKIAGLQLEGCRVTDPQKVLAAIGFQPGMPYDAERLQKALMDLGLFESVTLETTETTQGVQVTVKVREKTHPAPTTEDAARALNPIAVARRWLSSQLSLPLSEGEKGISLGVFRFNTTLEIDKTLFFVGDNAWIQKALKAADDKTARERLIAQLRQHLQKTPDDAWARFALAYLLMVQGHHDEADQQISTLLARQPNFHPVYALRLFAAFLRLSAFLKDRMEGQVEVSLPFFPLPPPDPASPGAVRWAIDEGIAHFRRLPDKAFTRDTLLAATCFFSNDLAAETFLLMLEMGDSQRGEECDIQARWEKFARRSADYLADYLRFSLLTESYASDLAVQKAMADWGQACLQFHLFFGFLGSFSAQLSTIDDAQQILRILTNAFRTQLRLMRPYLERHRWHLERLTVKNSPYRPDALNDLAKCLALLGDFSAAQKVMDTALRETGKLESETLTEVIGLHAFSEGNRLTPTLVARYVAWLDGLERQRPLPGSVALWLSYWRLWLAAKGSMFEKSSFMRGKKQSISSLPRPTT